MNKLETIVKELKKLQVYATEDVDSGPPQTLNGRRGRKNQAIERILQLRETYARDLLSSAVFFIVTGSAKESFGEIASASFSCFNANPEQVYQDIANKVPLQLLTGRESVAAVIEIASRHLEDKAREIGIVEINQILFKQQYRRAVTNRAELADLLKQVINEQIGSEIVGVQAVRSIVPQAIERDHSGTTTIVLQTSDEPFIASLATNLKRLTSKVFVVSAGEATEGIKALPNVIALEEVNKKTVGQFLKGLKGSIKK